MAFRQAFCERSLANQPGRQANGVNAVTCGGNGMFFSAITARSRSG